MNKEPLLLYDVSRNILYLSKDSSFRNVPSYRFNIIHGYFRTKPNGCTRFYGEISEEITQELDSLQDKIREIADEFDCGNRAGKATHPGAAGVGKVKPYTRMLSGKYCISFPISNWTKYRILTNRDPFSSRQLSFETAMEILSFAGSIVVNLPFLRCSSVIDPYFVLSDVLITKITACSNPHLTEEFMRTL